jgi:glycosyltransferase involved in cell wall biosynthesis
LNILIVSQYFWPEPFIINDLVIKMKALGHNVSIYTGKPNYPDGNYYDGYKKSGVQEEVYDNDIAVYRVPLRARKTGGAKNLILNYLSFIWFGTVHAFKFSKKKQFDSILVFAPSPITSAIPGIFIKWLTKSHLSIWVQDLWPESLSATGFVKNKFLLSCVRAFVKGIYSFSDMLLVQSKAFIPQVENLSPRNEIVYYPNSAKDEFSQKHSSPGLPTEFEEILDTHFCVVFAGNIGTAQSIETIIAAAKQLQEISDLKIVLVGSGSQLDWVKKQISDHDLSNVYLAGRFPSSYMPYVFSKSQALLVTLKKDEIFTFTVPCKVQAYLAAGKPIIAAIDGEGAKVIAEAKAGYTAPAEDPESLAINIKKMYDLSTQERAKIGEAGRNYFLQHFEMESQSERLISILQSSVTKRKRSK